MIDIEMKPTMGSIADICERVNAIRTQINEGKITLEEGREKLKEVNKELKLLSPTEEEKKKVNEAFAKIALDGYISRLKKIRKELEYRMANVEKKQNIEENDKTIFNATERYEGEREKVLQEYQKIKGFLTEEEREFFKKTYKYTENVTQLDNWKNYFADKPIDYSNNIYYQQFTKYFTENGFAFNEPKLNDSLGNIDQFIAAYGEEGYSLFFELKEDIKKKKSIGNSHGHDLKWWYDLLLSEIKRYHLDRSKYGQAVIKGVGMYFGLIEPTDEDIEEAMNIYAKINEFQQMADEEKEELKKSIRKSFAERNGVNVDSEF